MFNKTFTSCLKEYDLPEDLSFSCNLPSQVQEIVGSDILCTRLGITLRALNTLRAPSAAGETQSTVEYDENHFHADWLCNDERKAFKLGVYTILLLAQKFRLNNITGVRFCYSFQSPALAIKMATDLHLHEDGDEYYISDRLSFYSIREGEEVVAPELFDSDYFANLYIDV